ncbi:MAG TPA: M23 family metallopeptidase [Vicinamibacteria bacterium]|nr:M23 family metallopeptidase [Vicinamibacteria bacterium]
MIVPLAVSALLGSMLESTCGEAVSIRVSDPAPKQGSIGVVEVKSNVPLSSVGGFLAGEALHFWPDEEARVFQALLAVDLYESPGDTVLRVEAFPETGSSVECRVDLRIRDGGFPVQELKVEPKYVDPSPEDAARSQREAAELRRVFSSMTAERLWRKGFESPVAGHSPSGSFGKRRVFNGKPRSPHSGEDFGAPAGTPVRAPARGRVVLAKSLFFLGGTVILDHGFGLHSFYGHLSAIDVEPGALVEAGTVLGKVGASGRVTGAHLHWGVRLGEARVNPMDLLALGK